MLLLQIFFIEHVLINDNKMVGGEGFEPPDGGIKIRSLDQLGEPPKKFCYH